MRHGSSRRCGEERRPVASTVVLRRHAENVWQRFYAGKDPDAPAGAGMGRNRYGGGTRPQEACVAALHSIGENPCCGTNRLSVLNRMSILPWAEKAGLSDDKLRAVLSDDRTLFNDTERLVIELADAMTDTPANVSDDLYARLRNQSECVMCLPHCRIPRARFQIDVIDLTPAGQAQFRFDFTNDLFRRSSQLNSQHSLVRVRCGSSPSRS